MSRLVVASNRVADLENVTSSGGLAVAVGDALKEHGGVWFGWSGEIVESESETGLNLDRQGGVSIATQALTRQEYERYYLNYANRALWPVFHYRLDLAEFDSEALLGYRAVNKRFARSLAALVDREDDIWIHDYQMIPLAAELRAMGVENRIGFFLHIPFPPPEIILAVPNHDWLIDCLFACDVIGFQTENDLSNFKRYVAQTDPDVGVITHPYRGSGRSPVAKVYPIGIDVESFQAMARTEEADERIRLFHRGSIKDHIIGVERLDYSKGLPDRFRAYRRFLRRYPDRHKATVLMQIASPTREELAAYTDIRTELERLSGQINGAFGDFDWTPVRYIHRGISRDVLAALFRGSNVGLVTPLRDGMNLVAKEYVAAQDEADPGVLVLSRFAGAAADLEEALIVNPYDQDAVADALYAAVNMSVDERQERHKALMQRIRARDVTHWRTQFVDDLRGGA